MVTAGGSLIQDHAIGKVGDPPTYEFVAEAVPGDATIRASRITTPLFGLGLVDAVPDEELLRLANLQATRTPATAGSPSLVLEISSGHMRVGRFGWKAQVPTLHQFSGDAYLNEMGITNTLFPTENTSMGRSVAEFDTVADPEDPKAPPGEMSDVETFTRFMRATL